MSDDGLFDQDGPGLFDGPPAPEPAAAKATAPELPEAPLALYRRYRPDVFSEVIGQEHVTEPLRRALANNRVNHAYLFSGPRGCGKTSSARILARALNCVRGPTPDPCGECDSCRDLATGGPGSIDVIEIDAASHGGVDDARDLRERAFFAPVQSRYKVYIVDEAHMVTPQGFNALLKLVEEPPPHVKFVFATTEPDKVIGTIRSRTHHYPFRLVPPRTLSDYLARICAQEGVAAEPGVIGLVVRAGAGSVRDALSVLDQLLGAAGPDGIQYAQASALLGYTPDSLLDEYVDALAAGDAHGVFATVDKVVEAGQDPRRFAEDLLRRLRDLIIVATVDDAFASGLIDVPEDQAGRYQVQAKGLGPGELTRAAEVLAAGLTAMRGTTAPRLQLELMCARMLLPGADVADRGIHARLDRLERRLDMAPVSDEMTGPIAPKATSPAQAGAPAPTPSPAPSAAPPRRPPEPMAMPRAAVRPDAPPPAPTAPAAPPAPPAPAAPPVKLGAIDVADIRAHWPRILDEVKRRRKFTWFAVQQAQVTELSGNVLWLTFSQPGARAGFAGRGEEDVHQVIVDLLGADLVVRARAEDDPAPGREDSRPIPVAPPEPPADDIRPDDQVVPATAVDQEAEALVRQVLDAELVAED